MHKAAIQYSASLAERICDELTSGKTLREVCRGDKMPSEAAVRQWVRDDRDGFKQRYDTARELGCDALNDKLLELTDGAAPETAPLLRIKAASIMWYLQNIAPRRFGNRAPPPPPSVSLTVEYRGTPEGGAESPLLEGQFREVHDDSSR